MQVGLAFPMLQWHLHLADQSFRRRHVNRMLHQFRWCASLQGQWPIALTTSDCVAKYVVWRCWRQFRQCHKHMWWTTGWNGNGHRMKCSEFWLHSGEAQFHVPAWQSQPFTQNLRMIFSGLRGHDSFHHRGMGQLSAPKTGFRIVDGGWGVGFFAPSLGFFNIDDLLQKLQHVFQD